MGIHKEVRADYSSGFVSYSEPYFTFSITTANDNIVKNMKIAFWIGKRRSEGGFVEPYSFSISSELSPIYDLEPNTTYTRNVNMATLYNMSDAGPGSYTASLSLYYNGYDGLDGMDEYHMETIFIASAPIDSVSVDSLSISDIVTQVYTGAQITPHPTVSHNGTTLTEGTHYSLSWSNNTNPGTATVTVTGIGTYTGSKSVNFSITNRPITITAKDQAVNGDVGISTGTGQVTVGGDRTWIIFSS